MSTFSLTDADRKVLTRRVRLLSWIMTPIYLALAIGLGIYLLLHVMDGRSGSWKEIGESLKVAGFFGGVVAVLHVVLAWWESRATAAIRDDLAQGIKIAKTGCLECIDEGDADGGATMLQLRSSETGDVETFALRTITDLIRIRPQGLKGREVAIEYAPRSRIVLTLRSIVSPT
jgi:hypothetical protein